MTRQCLCISSGGQQRQRQKKLNRKLGIMFYFEIIYKLNKYQTITKKKRQIIWNQYQRIENSNQFEQWNNFAKNTQIPSFDFAMGKYCDCLLHKQFFIPIF